MGADVYLRSVFDANKKKAEPKFKRAVAARDKAPKGPARDKAQERVDAAFGELFGPGYFRDPYNGTTFLDKLDLSWWVDIVPRLNDGKLPIDQARWFINELRTRTLDDAKMLEVTAPDSTLEETRKFYEKDRADLIALLEKSIELDEPLDCSL